MPNDGMNAPGESNDEYETPPGFFTTLDTEFAFDFDAAAQPGNALCERFTSNIEASVVDIQANPDWTIWCNPPYSNIEPFVKAACFTKNTWVFLLPIRTRTKWFKTLRFFEKHGKAEFRFLRKRIHFRLNGQEPINPKTGKPGSPRFDSMIVVMR